MQAGTAAGDGDREAEAEGASPRYMSAALELSVQKNESGYRASFRRVKVSRYAVVC